MRLKNKVVMILLLSSMLILTLIGGINRKSSIKPDDVTPVPNEEVVDTIPETFKGKVNDTFDVPSEVMKAITDYMDAYYRSIYTLEKQDMNNLFSNEVMAAVSEKAIDLLIETRKLYDFDFTMNKAHYDLTITDYRKEDGMYYVDLLEDDYMSFNFLNGIESQAFDIENYFEIKEVDGTYKINNLEKVQGYYMNFYEEKDSYEELNSVYDYYFNHLKGQINYNLEVLKVKAETEPYVSEKTYTKAYNRTAAVSYSDLYYHSRNSEWYNFSDEGGNCQNYASQSMLAGGIDMDYTGEYQWKCYVTDPEYEPEINEEETPSGRTSSWVHVPSFYEYAKDNDDKGLAAECNVNLYYAEPGDIIIVGNGELAHTVIVSKVVDGHVLVNSNSIDMKDYPVEAYTYTTINLIKILGSN